MLKSLISETKNIYNLLKINGLPQFSSIDQSEPFGNLLGIFHLISQETIETNNKIKFESIFKIKKNVFYPISDNSDFNIGIFFIPKGSRIPLHDHPQMLVISKILTGSMNLTSIDFFDNRIQMELPKKLYDFIPMDGFADEVIKGKLNRREIVYKNELIYLTPQKGNVHQFEAIENSAIFDILVPKYDLIDRFCNFYEIRQIDDKDVSLKYLFPPPDYECYNMEKKLKF